MDNVTELQSRVSIDGLKVSRDRKKRRKLKRKLILRHHRNHWEELLRGTIPVFVAATINKIIIQLLELTVGTGGIRLQIIVAFLYALFIAHGAGYIVALYMPLNSPYYDYFDTLTSGNTSFAWSSCLTLVIMSWLYSSYPIGAAVCAWFILIVVVCVIIYVANYIQEKVMDVQPEIRQRLRGFESDSFALAVAYSLTVIIAASVYHDNATDYLSNTDDMNLASDFDDGVICENLRWLFFLYTALLTLAMVGYQWRLDSFIKRRRARLMAADLQRRSLSGGSAKERQEAASEQEVEEIHEQDLLLLQEDSDSSSLLLQDLASSSGQNNQNRTTIGRCLRHWCLWWDDDRSCLLSFQKFYYTTIAYVVASAWQIWCQLSFQGMFSFIGGPIFALFLFAVLVTVCVSILLTIVSVRKEINGLGLGGIEAEVTVSLAQPGLFDVEGVLYDTFGRLAVGWSWQNVFSASVSALLPAGGRLGENSRLGAVFAIKIVIAVLVTFLGCKLELYISSRREARSRLYDDKQRDKSKIDMLDGDDVATAQLTESLL